MARKRQSQTENVAPTFMLGTHVMDRLRPSLSAWSMGWLMGDNRTTPSLLRRLQRDGQSAAVDHHHPNAGEASNAWADELLERRGHSLAINARFFAEDTAFQGTDTSATGEPMPLAGVYTPGDISEPTFAAPAFAEGAIQELVTDSAVAALEISQQELAAWQQSLEGAEAVQSDNAPASGGAGFVPGAQRTTPGFAPQPITERPVRPVPARAVESSRTPTPASPQRAGLRPSLAAAPAPLSASENYSMLLAERLRRARGVAPAAPALQPVVRSQSSAQSAPTQSAPGQSIPVQTAPVQQPAPLSTGAQPATAQSAATPQSATPQPATPQAAAPAAPAWNPTKSKAAELLNRINRAEQAREAGEEPAVYGSQMPSASEIIEQRMKTGMRNQLAEREGVDPATLNEAAPPPALTREEAQRRAERWRKFSRVEVISSNTPAPLEEGVLPKTPPPPRPSAPPLPALQSPAPQPSAPVVAPDLPGASTSSADAPDSNTLAQGSPNLADVEPSSLARDADVPAEVHAPELDAEYRVADATTLPDSAPAVAEFEDFEAMLDALEEVDVAEAGGDTPLAQPDTGRPDTGQVNAALPDAQPPIAVPNAEQRSAPEQPAAEHARVAQSQGAQTTQPESAPHTSSRAARADTVLPPAAQEVPGASASTDRAPAAGPAASGHQPQRAPTSPKTQHPPVGSGQEVSLPAGDATAAPRSAQLERHVQPGAVQSATAQGAVAIETPDANLSVAQTDGAHADVAQIDGAQTDVVQADVVQADVAGSEVAGATDSDTPVNLPAAEVAHTQGAAKAETPLANAVENPQSAPAPATSATETQTSAPATEGRTLDARAASPVDSVEPPRSAQVPPSPAASAPAQSAPARSVPARSVPAQSLPAQTSASAGALAAPESSAEAASVLPSTESALSQPLLASLPGQSLGVPVTEAQATPHQLNNDPMPGLAPATDPSAAPAVQPQTANTQVGAETTSQPQATRAPAAMDSASTSANTSLGDTTSLPQERAADATSLAGRSTQQTAAAAAESSAEVNEGAADNVSAAGSVADGVVPSTGQPFVDDSSPTPVPATQLSVTSQPASTPSAAQQSRQQAPAANLAPAAVATQPGANEDLSTPRAAAPRGEPEAGQGDFASVAPSPSLHETRAALTSVEPTAQSIEANATQGIAPAQVDAIQADVANVGATPAGAAASRATVLETPSQAVVPPASPASVVATSATPAVSPGLSPAASVAAPTAIQRTPEVAAKGRAEEVDHAREQAATFRAQPPAVEGTPISAQSEVLPGVVPQFTAPAPSAPAQSTVAAPASGVDMPLAKPRRTDASARMEHPDPTEQTVGVPAPALPTDVTSAPDVAEPAADGKIQPPSTDRANARQSETALGRASAPQQPRKTVDVRATTDVRAKTDLAATTAEPASTARSTSPAASVPDDDGYAMMEAATAAIHRILQEQELAAGDEAVDSTPTPGTLTSGTTSVREPTAPHREPATLPRPRMASSTDALPAASVRTAPQPAAPRTASGADRLPVARSQRPAARNAAKVDAALPLALPAAPPAAAPVASSAAPTISRKLDPGIVQATSVEVVQRAPDEPDNPLDDTAEGLSLVEIARQVYPLIKDLLRNERDRFGSR